MNKKHVMKISPLVGAVVLALSAPLAMAAVTPPPANSLPGSFSSNNTVTYASIATNAATITVPSGATVLQFGGTMPTSGYSTVAAPSGITTNAGFDIGTGASLTVSNSATAAASVLISDQTGNPSQIYGTLTATGASFAPSLFVANANGVIVGNGATVTLPAGGGFIGENVSGASFTASGEIVSGTGTGVVNISGTVSNTGYLLVAGNGNVNVGTLVTGGTLSVVAGFNFTAAAGFGPSIEAGSEYVSYSSADLTLAAATGTVYAAGNVNLIGSSMSVTLGAVNGNLVNSGSATINSGVTIGGSFTNNGTATLATTFVVAGAATNNGTLTQDGTLTAGSIVNNGTDDLTTSGYNLVATAGTITNSGTISGSTVTMTASATSGAGIINTGTITNASSISMAATSGNISNSGTLNFTAAGGTLSAVASAGNVTMDGTVNIGTSATALSPSEYLGAVTLTASGGALNVGTMLYNSSTTAALSGNSVQVSAGGLIDVSSGVTLGVTAASGNVTLWTGTTLAATSINVNAGSTGNLVLAGQLGNSSSNTITVAAANVMAGANTMGGFNLSGSTSGGLTLDVYGNVVNQHGATAAAINYAKYVPVNANGGTANITLNNENAGTAVQYINLGVDGNAVLTGATSGASPMTVNGASGNNIANYPFGALTLQATGSIALGSSVTKYGFYFPGQLRFANVKTLSDSSFTLNSASTANITLYGELANDVTSQILGNGGISFLTDNVLSGVGTYPIITNTNAWINFPSGTGLATTYNTLNPGYPSSDAIYGLTYTNGVFNTVLVGGTNKANIFNSVTMP